MASRFEPRLKLTGSSVSSIDGFSFDKLIGRIYIVNLIYLEPTGSYASAIETDVSSILIDYIQKLHLWGVHHPINELKGKKYVVTVQFADTHNVSWIDELI